MNSPAASCVVVTQDRILASDLVEQQPLFRQLEPTTPVALSPSPSVRRILGSSELVAILRKHGVVDVFPVRALCVERLATQLNPADLIAAMHGALANMKLEIRLEDFSRAPVPPGQIEFTKASLYASAPRSKDSAVVWPGKVSYDGKHSCAIWARVLLSEERTLLTAKSDLRPGEPIAESDIERRVLRVFPIGPTFAELPEQAIGFKPRVTIYAGEPLALARLEQPWAVLRNDTVMVQVLEGSATLRLHAVALTSAHIGDLVVLRNPLNGRTFRAHVTGPRKANRTSGDPS